MLKISIATACEHVQVQKHVGNVSVFSPRIVTWC